MELFFESVGYAFIGFILGGLVYVVRQVFHKCTDDDDD